METRTHNLLLANMHKIKKIKKNKQINKNGYQLIGLPLPKILVKNSTKTFKFNLKIFKFIMKKAYL